MLCGTEDRFTIDLFYHIRSFQALEDSVLALNLGFVILESNAAKFSLLASEVLKDMISDLILNL